MFKVNNKNTRTTSMTLFLCFIVNFVHISHLFLVFVDFEQISGDWLRIAFDEKIVEIATKFRF